jgi:hypothetical protein
LAPRDNISWISTTRTSLSFFNIRMSLGKQREFPVVVQFQNFDSICFADFAAFLRDLRG